MVVLAPTPLLVNGVVWSLAGAKTTWARPDILLWQRTMICVQTKLSGSDHWPRRVV